MRREAKTTRSDSARCWGLANTARLENAQDWVCISSTSGQYGEVFERNIGQGSVHEINAGLNALWNNGASIRAAS